MAEDNVIFVGEKPLMNYVTGVAVQFSMQDRDNVIIKARGRFISKAVDIAEVATKRFLEEKAKLGDIKIGSEEFENKEGKDIRVSIIEINLKRV